jgi:hypothetical protein
MPRHHNRAILSAITDRNLDPTKNYVVGKSGLRLSSKDARKFEVSDLKHTVKDEILQLPSTEKVLLQEKNDLPSVESLDSVDEKLTDAFEKQDQFNVEISDVDSVSENTFSEKQTKFKKKVKPKTSADQS